MADIDPALLSGVTLFSALSEEQRAKLVEAGEVTAHEAGDELASEGAIGYRFYLLLEGGAAVERAGETVASVGPGDFVGEIALLGGGVATATVRCTTATRCLTLRRERFWQLLESEPGIALRLLEVVCRRLAEERGATATANLPTP